MTINEAAVLFAFVCFIGTLIFVTYDAVHRPLIK